MIGNQLNTYDNVLYFYCALWFSKCIEYIVSLCSLNIYDIMIFTLWTIILMLRGGGISRGTRLLSTCTGTFSAQRFSCHRLQRPRLATEFYSSSFSWQLTVLKRLSSGTFKLFTCTIGIVSGSDPSIQN